LNVRGVAQRRTKRASISRASIVSHCETSRPSLLKRAWPPKFAELFDESEVIAERWFVILKGAMRLEVLFDSADAPA
jgi:hypothetical protein